VSIIYVAADFGEEFDFEFLETDSPELIPLNDSENDERSYCFGVFLIPRVERQVER
jgi:hypothetical protein